MPTTPKRPRTKAQREADAKRPGRPPLPKGQKRSAHRLTVYFSGPEYRAFRREAKASGESMARFLVETWREASGFAEG
jgi:hypothetical protein